MTVDHSRVRVQHFCEPPTILTIEFADEPPALPTCTVHHPEGTRFTCDVCWRRWRVVRRPDRRDSGIVVVGGLEWVGGSPLAALLRRWRHDRRNT